MSLHAQDDPLPYCKGRGSQALMDTAKTSGWTVISMKDDWKTTFAGDAGTSRRRNERRGRNSKTDGCTDDQEI
jgi:hypothetical protein